jgi:hypothetical protein
MRLNLWDFDDTLAASVVAVDRMAAEYPEIPYKSWWQDPKLSTAAVLETRPFPSIWRTLRKTPGRHVLFSGRVPDALSAWLDLYSHDPIVGPGIAMIDASIPVPLYRHTGERILDVKLRLIRTLVADGERDIHLYDDHADLPAMVEAARIPGLTLHRVAHGRLLNGRAGCRCGGHAHDV